MKVARGDNFPLPAGAENYHLEIAYHRAKATVTPIAILDDFTRLRRVKSSRIAIGVTVALAR